MAKSCLYCGLQLPDTAGFCPQCGRPIERSYKIRPIQESEFDYLREEMKGKDGLPTACVAHGIRTRGVSTPLRSVRDVLL